MHIYGSSLLGYIAVCTNTNTIGSQVMPGIFWGLVWSHVRYGLHSRRPGRHSQLLINETHRTVAIGTINKSESMKQQVMFRREIDIRVFFQNRFTHEEYP